MNLKLQSSVLITNKFDEMKHFYQSVLYQHIELDFGNCIGFKSGISIWELKPNYTISKSLGYTYSAKGNNNLELCFETDDFIETINELNFKSLSLIHDVIIENWGQKTIRFYDPDKNIIEIGESTRSFVRRFYNEGLSCTEITNRTSIPIEIVDEYIKS